MLMVSACIKPSPIHGLGCFTNEKIKKGQVVWVYDPRVDVRIPVSELPSLPEPMQAFLHMYGYGTIYEGQEVIVLCGDHAKHMNHADVPNVVQADESGMTYVAARDIEAGEELTCDYYSFDLEARRKLGT